MRRDQQHIDQPTFFESSVFCEAKRAIDRTPARNSDPATSHEGAAHIASELSAAQEHMLEAFRTWTMTDNEAAEWCVAKFGKVMHDSYRKRGKEIRDRLTLVEVRPCAVTGRSAQVWSAKR